MRHLQRLLETGTEPCQNRLALVEVEPILPGLLRQTRSLGDATVNSIESDGGWGAQEYIEVAKRQAGKAVECDDLSLERETAERRPINVTVDGGIDDHAASVKNQGRLETPNHVRLEPALVGDESDSAQSDKPSPTARVNPAENALDDV